MPHVTTNDGVRLHYEEAGSGDPLVLIHGWSQSAAMFKHQLDGLGDRHRVIALDLRGHGESDKPDHGYRLSRLAKDVRDFLAALELRDVTLLGWSMGCSVIWSYWDLFGPERIARIVLVDEPPWILHTPDMSQQERGDAGSILDFEGTLGAYNALRGPEPEARAFTEAFVGGMFTAGLSPEAKAWVIDENLKMPRDLAACLLLIHVCLDWRDVIPRISVPTLVIGGKASHVPWKSQLWIQAQIPGSRVEIFEEDEGGAHFMFLENPDKFNRLLGDFIATSSAVGASSAT